ncbi:MAG: 50S ribosomal protein L19 [Candidatus Yonathbacteria bacterium]|nr:50S ribosomal protein L19 [Candidatus Yonathbacteria bacterium]
MSPVVTASRKDLPIRAGATVKVHLKIEEKGKTRMQIFEGLVLSVKGGTGNGAMFTVRKVASGVGVEKIFPLYSPSIDKIEIVRQSEVSRAKLFFVRNKVARDVKRKMRHTESGATVPMQEEDTFETIKEEVLA